MITVTILLALIGLGVVIFVHELGHFLGARLGGMRVRQLALGFGWRLCGFRRNGTDYRINAVPLGGYVMVDGNLEESDDPASRDPRLMQNRPPWARALFALSGPLFNLLFSGVILLAILGVRGLPAGREVALNAVTAGAPGWAAGLRPGDVIISINGQSVASAAAVADLVKASTGEAVFRVRRGREELTLSAQPHEGRIGVTLGERMLYSRRGLTPGLALGQSGRILIGMAADVVRTFIMLVTGQAGIRDLSGPVGMVTAVAATASSGLANFLTILAFIGVNLALFNLLPIPALDGGRLALLAGEKLFGPRFTQTRQAVIHLAGYIVILLLVVWVSILDVLRIVH